jgi:hypothetical protein
MAKAPFNLAHPAAAVTLARYFAKREVQWEVHLSSGYRCLRRVSDTINNLSTVE